MDYDGAEIAQADVVKLCAKCHGTIYRDWQAGVHGRQNGFWNAEHGRQDQAALHPMPRSAQPEVQGDEAARRRCAIRPRAANPPADGKPETAAHH